MSKEEEMTADTVNDSWVSQVYIYRDGEVWWGSWNEEKAEWNPWHRLGISDPHPFNGPVEMGKPVDTLREHKYVEQDFRDE